MTLLKSVVESALQVSTDNQLIAYGLAVGLVIVWFYSKRRTARTGGSQLIPVLALVLGAIMALTPTLADIYLDRYRSTVTIRVGVIGPDGAMVDDAVVTANVGGETKTVAGGWEIDVPADRLPSDGIVEISARRPSAFARGVQRVDTRGQRRLVSTTVTLVRDTHARIRGIVLDSRGRAVPGVRVMVIGYGAEAVVTSASGSFDLPAHAAPGQQVQLHAEKAGAGAVLEHVQAGETPVQVRLRRTQ